MHTFTLENETLHLEFARDTGALVGLCAVESDWQLLNRPHLGLSFRLMVPLPGRRNNSVFGERQPVSSGEISPDRRAVTFGWDTVTSEHGGPLAIGVTLHVRLTARQAVFTLTVANRSGYPVESAYCPYLGDVQPPPQDDWFRTFLYLYATAQEWSLWPTYQNLFGCSADHPVQFSPLTQNCGAPMAPFILLRGATQGLYVGVDEPSSELVAWHTELRPGVGSMMDGHVPDRPAIGGLDVATRFAAVHMPFIQPGETRVLTPVALEVFQGGWQRGVDIYKARRSRWMNPALPPPWARTPHAWQQIQINSPEDELRVRFGDLPQVGRECARHGVKAIQLVGWNDGGQDRHNPTHTPDPRLGTGAELKAAIAEIQALGVKVILFTKYTWADRATERFRNDLIRLAIKDPYGDYYHYQGYQHMTATQLLDINTRRFVPLCFLSEEYLRICEDEFRKVLELGADGILFDECEHHSPALLCFDTSHGHRYGAPVYAHDCQLIERFGRLVTPLHREFLFAGEACYDWEFAAYQLSYHRSASKEHLPLTRYLLPEAALMTAVTGFNDRHMINQCLLYRYIISYEPYHFKGRLDDFPLTVAYGRQMDALRTEWREYFWDGEFRHEIGASVLCAGRPYRPYAVFVSRVTGKAGVVIVNYDDRDAVTVEVSVAGGGSPGRYRLVDDPAWQPAARGITIPAASAAVAIPWQA